MARYGFTGRTVDSEIGIFDVYVYLAGTSTFAIIYTSRTSSTPLTAAPQTGTSSRVFRINMDTFEVSPAGQPPYAHGTAVIGNRMEIIVTADGLKYLYLMRSTGSELWRTLLWW